MIFFFPVPASFPDNVTALANSSTTIIVSWVIVPPIDQNGILTMYEVLYQPLETFEEAIDESLTTNVSASDMSVVLMGLQEFVEYNISVRAYTSVGEGPYSEEIITQTDTDSKYRLHNEAEVDKLLRQTRLRCLLNLYYDNKFTCYISQPGPQGELHSDTSSIAIGHGCFLLHIDIHHFTLSRKVINNHGYHVTKVSY